MHLRGGGNIIERSLGVGIIGVWHSHIFSYHIFTYLEIFICLAYSVKNFEGPIGGGLPIVVPEISRLLEISHFRYPQILSNFIFYIHLT